MYCRVAFKVYTNAMADKDMFAFMDILGVEGGITDGCIYFGLSERNTDDEDFQLSSFIYESLSVLINKADTLRRLKNTYDTNYVLNVKFEDIEYEIRENRSFYISDEIKEFLRVTDTYYNLNDGYFEEE